MYQLIIILCMLLSYPAFSQVEEFTFDNGLKLLVQEDHRAPIVVSMIWYHVGSADEPGGLTGISHAIEHMMFKGTKTYPLGVFSKTIAALGGQDNAFTNNDYTAFFEKIDSRHLAKCFELEADRMTNLLLDPDEFTKEINVIQEERRLRTDDNPQALAFERLLATAHLSSPYQHPVIGWMGDLERMQVEHLKKWYHTYYAPNNATLVVVGDVDPRAVYQLAQHYFGTIPKRLIPATKIQQEPPALGKKQIVVHSTAKLPLFLVGYTVPSVTTATQNYEPYALELIASILDAGDGARLTKNLIRGNHVATGADTYYNLYAKYQTQFILYGAPSQNHSMKELRKALLAELVNLQSKPVSPDELKRIKNQIIAQKTFEKDSTFSQAMELGLLETVGLGWKKSQNYKQAILDVTPEQIQKTAQKYFQENNSTEAELIPTQTGEPKA